MCQRCKPKALHDWLEVAHHRQCRGHLKGQFFFAPAAAKKLLIFFVPSACLASRAAFASARPSSCFLRAASFGSTTCKTACVSAGADGMACWWGRPGKILKGHRFVEL